MTNYILTFKIKEQRDVVDFVEAIKEKYPDNRLEVRHEIPYFAFAARDLPEVEENVVTMIKDIGIAKTDYVALYYVKEEDSDKIMRLMILGPSDLADQDLEVISTAEHENLLSDLFDIDFMKLRFEKQEK